MTLAGILLLCVIAAGVVYWLPDMDRRHGAGTEPAPSKISSSQDVMRHERPAGHRHQKERIQQYPYRQKALTAEQLWLEKKARAELENMDQWGGKEYARALTVAHTALKQLQEKNFSRAATSFSEAATLIDEIEASKDRLLEQAVETGIQALEQGLQKKATQAFSTALAIEPANSKALAGLKRASTIVQVHSMLQHAREQSEAGEPESVLKVTEAILKIDPLCTEARRIGEQARYRIKRKKFDSEMGKAISALSAHRYSEAQKALRQARALFPSDPPVAELSARIETARTASELRFLIEQANMAQKEEEWEKAITLYRKALTTDPLSVTAKQGLARCQRMHAIETSLKKIIEDPWNLNQQGPLSDAKNTVRMAQDVDAPGPVLKKLTAQAQDVLHRWQQKVEVTFVSDNMTDVIIYHVGRLGKFKQRTLRLRPGTYTVKGMRQGYRDVIERIRISPDTEKIRMDIRCIEKI